MESFDGQTHFVKRVVLPSGKTIEVVYFKDSEAHPATPVAEPEQDLHLCLECDSDLVYPLEWEEAGPENWSVLLHCPNCDVYREGETLLTAGYNESVCFATAHGYTMPTAWENALAKAWQVKFPGRAFRLDGSGTNFPSSPLRRWEALHAMGYLG